MKKLSYIAVGAGLNFAGLFAAVKVAGLAGVSAASFTMLLAIVLALIATSALHYFLTYTHLRQQIEQEVEDELFPGDDDSDGFPRRFNETNFK